MLWYTFMFLDHNKFFPTSGTLHLLFSLPGILFFLGFYMACFFLISQNSFLNVTKAAPDDLI